MDALKLTQYSHGAGCGCKISPAVLDTILHGTEAQPPDPRLLVGYQTRDDAAVYDMHDGTGLISTTDFFMPIVDDAYTFGRIAATNAISDVYAMGGTPLMAIAILGWPVNTLPPEAAARVLDGGRAACREAGIVLAGGHSIDCPEPVFGLAVTGTVPLAHLKRNSTARPGNHLYLTKPLGVGILTTAQKKGLLRPEHARLAPDLMTRLNKLGPELARIPGVTALTDVTGFGLLGHLSEMCEGGGLSAVVQYNRVPLLPETAEYVAQKCIPGGTTRNWDSYGAHIALADPIYKTLLCDPQTSGGLLVAVSDEGVPAVEALLQRHGLPAQAFGQFEAAGEARIAVR